MQQKILNVDVRATWGGMQKKYPTNHVFMIFVWSGTLLSQSLADRHSFTQEPYKICIYDTDLSRRLVPVVPGALGRRMGRPSLALRALWPPPDSGPWLHTLGATP